MRLPCLRAQLRGSCETQPREAGSTYWVQVRPTFLPRLLSSLTLSRPLLPSGCPAGLLGRDRPPRATLTRPPPGAPCSRRGCSQGHLVKVREPASWDAFSALLCSPGHKRRGVLEGSRRGGERRTHPPGRRVTAVRPPPGRRGLSAASTGCQPQTAGPPGGHPTRAAEACPGGTPHQGSGGRPRRDTPTRAAEAGPGGHPTSAAEAGPGGHPTRAAEAGPGGTPHQGSGGRPRGHTPTRAAEAGPGRAPGQPPPETDCARPGLQASPPGSNHREWARPRPAHPSPSRLHGQPQAGTLPRARLCDEFLNLPPNSCGCSGAQELRLHSG